MNTTEYGNPKEIIKICEWTGKQFSVDWKHRHQRFINKDAMYEWRKYQNREIVNCLKCNKPFERYRNILHPDTMLPTQYCSNECNRSSKEKKNSLRKWIINNNPMNNPLSVEKIKQSKLKTYGDPFYNNVEKQKQTMVDRHGVVCAFFLPKCKSNGKRVSNFQKRIFADIKQKYPDAELEKYLPDVQKSVDIYIPSIKKVVECYGDYWHCNPSKCIPTYYNKLVHLTAQEIWNRDKERIDMLRKAGYTVEIIWENSNKRFKN